MPKELIDAAKASLVPLMVAPDKLSLVGPAMVRAHEAFNTPGEALVSSVVGDPVRAFLDAPRPGEHVLAPYTVLDGVLHVPVRGVLMPNVWGSLPGITGYEYIMNALQMGEEDPNVESVVLAIDSPGGTVMGAFELASYIAGYSKPVTAVASYMATSAAYLIASGADKIIATQTGMLGSIGVVLAHFSLQDSFRVSGVRVTLMYAGDRKVDLNPYQDLPDDVKSRYQAEVNEIAAKFINFVAEHRGITVESVQNQQAMIYSGQAAVDNGLADQVFAHIVDALKPKERDMSNKTNTGDGITMSEHAAEVEKAVAAAKAEAVSEERARISAILKLGEGSPAKAHVAKSLAFNTAMSVEDASIVINDLPDVEAAAPSHGAEHFSEAMDRAAMTVEPKGEEDSGSEKESDLTALISDAKSAFGIM